MDAREIALLLKEIRIQETGVGVLDGELFYRDLRCAGGDISGLGCLGGFHFPALEVIGETIVTNVAAREPVRLGEEIVEEDEFAHVADGHERLHIGRRKGGGAENGGRGARVGHLLKGAGVRQVRAGVQPFGVTILAGGILKQRTVDLREVRREEIPRHIGATGVRIVTAE